MEKNASEIKDTLAFIVERMATKDDIAELRAEMNEGFASIRAEIRDIRQQLTAIEAELKNHAGFAKEIDLLMDRVRAIEKHLGIQHKIAA